jgi:cytidylate kinase
MSESRYAPRIAIVGPCGAGKSTLAQALQERGYQARQITQEHSFAPAMWQLITNPDVLIYLDASFPVASQRKSLDWNSKDHREQLHRLRHAREHCHIYIQTDGLTAAQVLEKALMELKALGLRGATG